MIAEQHRKLVNALLHSTQQGKIEWDKEGHLSYFAKLNGLKFLIDKYFSIVDDQKIACVNLAIFEKEDILDEVVVCTYDHQEEDFDLFDGLYKQVEKQFSEKAQQTIYPKIDRITIDLESGLAK